jgi:hypothetical protein
MKKVLNGFYQKFRRVDAFHRHGIYKTELYFGFGQELVGFIEYLEFILEILDGKLRQNRFYGEQIVVIRRPIVVDLHGHHGHYNLVDIL